LKNFRAELERSLEAFETGLVALLAGEADEAISRLKLFVAEFPNSVSGRVNLGASYLAKIRMKSGTPQNLSEVLPVLPEPGIKLRSPIDRLVLNQARENFKKALEIQPDEPMAQAGLALVEMRLSEFDKAREHLQKARATSPNRAELVLCQGNVEFLTENFPAAASLYMESLKLRPEWPEALKNLARTYEEMGEVEKAHEIWSTLGTNEKLEENAENQLEIIPEKTD
jgi:tetratricopeptide (TPR) repeat protein